MQLDARPFGDAEQQYLVEHLQKQRKIVIRTIPDGKAMDLADRIHGFLLANGYQVDPVDHSILMAAGPNGPPRGVKMNTPPDETQPTEIFVGY